MKDAFTTSKKGYIKVTAEIGETIESVVSRANKLAISYNDIVIFWFNDNKYMVINPYISDIPPVYKTR